MMMRAYSRLPAAARAARPLTLGPPPRSRRFYRSFFLCCRCDITIAMSPLAPYGRVAALCCGAILFILRRWRAVTRRLQILPREVLLCHGDDAADIFATDEP